MCVTCVHVYTYCLCVYVCQHVYTIQYNTIQIATIRYNTIQNNTIQNNTIQNNMYMYMYANKKKHHKQRYRLALLLFSLLHDKLCLKKDWVDSSPKQVSELIRRKEVNVDLL